MSCIEQRRGAVVESVHPYSAYGVDAQGRVVFATGPDLATTWRSASKPFQLETSLEAARDPAVDAEDLAIGAASHSAEDAHVARVEALLSHFGLTVAHLRCGAHAPVHEPSATAILRAGGHFSAVHNNCSGKHAFMLAACVSRGWDLEYRPPSHPLQVRNRQRLEELCGGEAVLATDGCGVPTFGFPISGLARAWAALAHAMADANVNPRLHAIGWAMARHPELTSGTGRLDLQIVRGAAEPMAVKIGAGGVFCLALPARRLGLAVKVHSGVGEALPAAVAATLAAAAPGAFVASADWALLRVRNVVGDVVGDFRAT